MKLTRASSYALQAVVYMASQRSTEHPIASHTIAQSRKIPERFLLKVLKPLVQARVLSSVKGPNGGYRLAKPANEITMLEILEAVDGDIRGQVPIDKKDEQSSALKLQLDTVCKQAAQIVREHLENVKLSDLLKV